jgi:hypothetical protein
MGPREYHDLKRRRTTMLSKHQVDASMSGFRGLTRRVGCLALLLVAFAGNAHAQGNNNQGNNNQGNGGRHVAPEIATGAAVTASLLAGGGLLLLADRLRRKKSSSS